LAIGVRKDWPLLASALDKALDSITDRERLEIKNRWLAFKYEAGINWRIVGPIGATLLAIIAFVLMWNRRLGRAIRERERSERKIKAMSQAVDDALVMIDGRGKVLFWNQAAENLFGYTVAEAMGKDFHEMAVPAEAREKAQAGMRRFAATGQGLFFGAARETTAINRSGETFPVEVNLSPFQVDDEWFAVVTVRDITERKKAEDALKEYVADLERFNRLVIGREERMIQLKEEINGLTEKLGGEKKYKIV
jgi:PAS domain S-box-containing protein